jgi:hypothetical protein
MGEVSPDGDRPPLCGESQREQSADGNGAKLNPLGLRENPPADAHLIGGELKPFKFGLEDASPLLEHSPVLLHSEGEKPSIKNYSELGGLNYAPLVAAP